MATRTRSVEVTLHEVVPTRCYAFNDRLWVPHHLKPHTYVAPGGKTLPEEVLVRYNAIPVTQMLWPRPWRSEYQV